MSVFVGARPMAGAAQKAEVPAERGDLSGLRKAELMEMAIGLGLEVRSGTTKARLVEMIEGAR